MSPLEVSSPEIQRLVGEGGVRPHETQGQTCLNRQDDDQRMHRQTPTAPILLDDRLGGRLGLIVRLAQRWVENDGRHGPYLTRSSDACPNAGVVVMARCDNRLVWYGAGRSAHGGGNEPYGLQALAVPGVEDVLATEMARPGGTEDHRHGHGCVRDTGRYLMPEHAERETGPRGAASSTPRGCQRQSPPTGRSW